MTTKLTTFEIATLGTAIIAIAISFASWRSNERLAVKLQERQQAFERELQAKQQKFEDNNRVLDRLLQRAQLEHNATALEPQNGRPGPFIATVFNRGTQQAVIVKVDFQIIQGLETPTKYGMAPIEAYKLAFHNSDYDNTTRRFSVSLKRPIAINGGENTLLYIAIVESGWQGKSYFGNLIIHYDHGEPLTISGVTLDCLDEEFNVVGANAVR